MWRYCIVLRILAYLQAIDGEKGYYLRGIKSNVVLHLYCNVVAYACSDTAYVLQRYCIGFAVMLHRLCSDTV